MFRRAAGFHNAASNLKGSGAMKAVTLLAILGIALSGLAQTTFAQSATDTTPKLDCGRGPATKSFGGAPWLIYACSDGRSIVLVSAPESPASPFYFMFNPNSTGHRLIGEGTGDKTVTDNAYKELKALSETDIRLLFAEATKVVAH